MVRMALPTEPPHMAAESSSRQCSLPGAGTGVSKDGHPKGSGLSGTCVCVIPPRELQGGVSGRSGRRAAALSSALPGTSGAPCLGIVGMKGLGCGRHCCVLQPVSGPFSPQEKVARLEISHFSPSQDHGDTQSSENVEKMERMTPAQC